MMGLNCKTLSNNSKREILSLKTKEKVPTRIAEIAENFNSPLQALCSHLWIMDQDPVAENKQGKNRFYSINKERTLDLIFEDIYDYNLATLKEYLETKEWGTMS